MNNFIKLVFAALTTVLLIACGGDSNSDSSFEGEVTFGEKIYQCNSENAFDSCTENEENCSSCTCTSGCDVEPTVPVTVNACTNDGTTTLAEGESCSLGNNTYTCKGGRIEGGAFIAGGKLTINGATITCE